VASVILIKSGPMRDRGRLTAPGDLLNGSVLAPEADSLTEPDEGSRSLAELAARYGLRPSSARPGLVSYLRVVCPGSPASYCW
jgi:hypothetical protein